MKNSQKVTKKPRKKTSNRRFGKEDFQQDRMSADCNNNKFQSGKVTSNNSPSWYFKDSQILNDVASFSFNTPVGTRLHFDKYHVPNDTVVNNASTSSVPGVLAVYIGLTAGVAENAQSPVNLGATNVYSYVRYKNSGSANYDSPDLMLYLIAMDSLYAAWNWMKRIYGYVSSYSQRNTYMPRAYAEADCVDFDDIIANLADFRGWLNIKAQEIAAFCVPATMSYMVRHSWLFSNVYTDSNTAKAQQYMYTPAWFYEYDETSSPQGGLLVPVAVNFPRTPNKWTFAALQNLLNGMLEAMNYSEDIGIMSGDILKAYSQSGLFTLSSIPDDYKVMPVFSEEVLTQIENAQVFDMMETSELSQFNITQDPNTNYLKCTPRFTTNVPRQGGYLNFHWDNPTPEQVIVASRLKPSFLVQGTGGSTVSVLTSVGSEIAVGATTFQYVSGADITAAYNAATPLQLVASDLNFSLYPNLNGEDAVTDMARYMAMLNSLFSFDWGPELIFGYATGTSDPIYYSCGTTRDWDNYVQIDDQDIVSMNLLALLSEFNVPN